MRMLIIQFRSFYSSACQLNGNTRKKKITGTLMLGFRRSSLLVLIQLVGPCIMLMWELFDDSGCMLPPLSESKLKMEVVFTSETSTTLPTSTRCKGQQAALTSVEQFISKIIR
jgi:hypothetical protein